MTASHPIATDAEQAARARQVAEALHSAALEGQAVTPATHADMDDYVTGAVDADGLVERIRARYGLD